MKTEKYFQIYLNDDLTKVTAKGLEESSRQYCGKSYKYRLIWNVATLLWLDFVVLRLFSRSCFQMVLNGFVMFVSQAHSIPHFLLQPVFLFSSELQI